MLSFAVYTCPNDGFAMESDEPMTAAARKRRGNCACLHTCPECGYAESR